MKRLKVEGVIPPMITPFDEEGNVHEPALRRLVDFLAERVQALYPVGTYGSGPAMAISERQRAAEMIMEQVNGRIPVIMHVGCVDTKTTVALAKHAEKIGAPAVASIAPFYYEHNERAIEYHFQRLMEAVSIPVFAYNNPKLSRNSISPTLLARLAEQGLAGIKDSSFDILVFYAYLRMVKQPDFTFIIGTEALALPALTVGGSACVAGLANALPELVVDLYKACRAKDLQAAVALQQKTLVVREIMHLAPIAISGIHAILQMRGIDAGRQAERLDQPFREGNLYQRTGCRNNSMYLPAKILWIKEEMPCVFAKTAKLISMKDYMAQHLTGGAYRTDYIIASASGLFNIHEKRWEPELQRLVGFPESCLPEAVPPQTSLGEIRKEVARRTGLCEGTPVFAGGGDGPLSNIGVGAIEPGELNLSIGSGGILRMILDRPRLCSSQRTWCYLLKEDLWVLGGVNNGGMVLQWFWETFWGRGLIRGRREKERFLLLDDWSSSVPLGCDGLIFLPYLTGERSPHWRREAKASFFGIDSHHHRGHFARAVMEGLGFQMKRVFQVMEEIGGTVSEVRFTGGFTRSPLWSQMMCDILGREVRIPRVKDSSALGAAAMTALGLGLIPSLGAVKAKVEVEKTLRPHMESYQRYQRLYGLFQNLYQDSVRGWEELKEIVASEESEVREGGGR